MGVLINGKINMLKHKFDEIVDEFNNFYDEVNNKTSDDNNVEEYMNTKNNIDNLITEMNDLFTDKNFGIDNGNSCEFKDHCMACSNQEENYKKIMFCLDTCSRCGIFRKLKDKSTTAECIKYYEENIEPKNKQIQDKTLSNNVKIPKGTKIVNIHNNLTINNITYNYINTKDLFYHVVITSNEANASRHLRYMFTFLMCGMSGRKLFPNEIKYSKAITFPVSAAKFNIVIDNKQDQTYTLYGVLRYEYQNTCAMTIKKLEKMGDDKFTVKAYTPNLGKHKTHVLKDDIDCFLNTVKCTDNGSDIEKFYMNDNTLS